MEGLPGSKRRSGSKNKLIKIKGESIPFYFLELYKNPSSINTLPGFSGLGLSVKAIVNLRGSPYRLLL